MYVEVWDVMLIMIIPVTHSLSPSMRGGGGGGGGGTEKDISQGSVLIVNRRSVKIGPVTKTLTGPTGPVNI